MSNNPTNLGASARVLAHGATAAVFPTPTRVELTNNTPIATALTSSSPFGFVTADQGDDLVATVREMRAALITAGICIDSTANAD